MLGFHLHPRRPSYIIRGRNGNIKGWQEGLAKMKEGGKATLACSGFKTVIQGAKSIKLGGAKVVNVVEVRT